MELDGGFGDEDEFDLDDLLAAEQAQDIIVAEFPAGGHNPDFCASERFELVDPSWRTRVAPSVGLAI
jgi:hypothetical protein